VGGGKLGIFPSPDASGNVKEMPLKWGRTEESSYPYADRIPAMVLSSERKGGSPAKIH